MAVTRYFAAHYIESKVGKTGLADVTINIYRISDQVKVINAAATVEIGDGFYFYSFAAADQDEEYLAAFTTANTDVDQRTLPGMDWTARILDGVWDELLTGAIHNTTQSAGKRLRTIAGLLIHEGTAQGPGTGTNQIQLAAEASAVNGFYDPSLIQLVNTGTGSGQCRLVLEYDGATRTATVDRDWKVNPDDTTDYQILGDAGREHVNEGLARGATLTTLTLNALASGQDDSYIGQVIFIRAGTGADQAKRVIDYDGNDKIATVQSAWDVTPDTTSAYVMLPTAAFDIATLLAGVADSVWDELLAGHQDAGSAGETLSNAGGLSAADIWAYTRRTLTHIAAAALNAISGSTVSVYNYSTWSFDITGLGDISDRTKLYFTVKINPDDDPDTASMLQVRETKAGPTTALLYFDGEDQSDDPTKGSLVVNDETVGNITVTVDMSITKVKPQAKLKYEVRKVTATEAVPIRNGRFDILATTGRVTT